MIIELNYEPNNKQCKIKCDQCGHIIYRSHAHTVRARHHFCDIICRTEWELDITHHPAWKGGEITRLGYVFIKVKNHPHADILGYVKRSRLVMEAYLGRYLTPEEAIHHLNEIRDDDRLENLQLCSSNSEHMRIGHSKVKARRKQLQLALI
jgi:hypothetical protein